MAIKLVIFDLDGVLADTKLAHFDALNKALEKNNQQPISYEEHIHKFDGLPTKEKLNLLLPEDSLVLKASVLRDKQTFTQEALENVEVAKEVNELLTNLKILGIKFDCVSNAVKETTFNILDRFVYPFDGIYTPDYPAEHEAKPNPQMYLLSMANHKVTPKETLIIEDSPKGLTAAYESGANVLPVKDIHDLTINKVMDRINKLDKKISNPVYFETSDLNILIPMAGAGSRFAEAGYTFPKPLIEVNGKPMIQLVVENIGLKGNFIFICQKEHYDKYNLSSLLNLIAPNCKIVIAEGMTEGAACTALLAREYLMNDNPLLIANSDQYVEYDPMGFIYKSRHYDGSLLTFNATHPKWSFAEVEDGYVKRIAEKDPISNVATAGIYYWSRSKDFVKSADSMIEKDIRTNNEFYIAPVFNELIKQGGQVVPYFIENMYGLGTPEDLRSFLERGIYE